MRHPAIDELLELSSGPVQRLGLQAWVEKWVVDLHIAETINPILIDDERAKQALEDMARKNAAKKIADSALFIAEEYTGPYADLVKHYTAFFLMPQPYFLQKHRQAELSEGE